MKTYSAPFKQCSGCGRVWAGRSEFLGGGNVQPVGYQVNFGELEMGFVLFNHLACRSTIAIHAGRFVDLYEGPTYQERKTGSDDRPAHCLHEDDLAPCPALCECSYVRSAIQIVKNWPKDTPGSRAARQIIR